MTLGLNLAERKGPSINSHCRCVTTDDRPVGRSLAPPLSTSNGTLHNYLISPEPPRHRTTLLIVVPDVEILTSHQGGDLWRPPCIDP